MHRVILKVERVLTIRGERDRESLVESHKTLRTSLVDSPNFCTI